MTDDQPIRDLIARHTRLVNQAIAVRNSDMTRTGEADYWDFMSRAKAIELELQHRGFTLEEARELGEGQA